MSIPSSHMRGFPAGNAFWRILKATERFFAPICWCFELSPVPLRRWSIRPCDYIVLEAVCHSPWCTSSMPGHAHIGNNIWRITRLLLVFSSLSLCLSVSPSLSLSAIRCFSPAVGDSIHVMSTMSYWCNPLRLRLTPFCSHLLCSFYAVPCACSLQSLYPNT